MVKGNSAAANADPLIYDCMAAFYMACASFMSQNYGAGKPDRVKKSYFISLAYSFGVGLALGGGLFLFGRQFLALFTTESAVIDAGMKRVGVMALAYCTSAFMDCTIAASRGLGKTVVPTIIVILGSCVFRVIWVYTIFAHFHTIPSLYLLYPCSWALTAFAEILYFIHCYKHAMKIFRVSVPLFAVTFQTKRWMLARHPSFLLFSLLHFDFPGQHPLIVPHSCGPAGRAYPAHRGTWPCTGCSAGSSRSSSFWPVRQGLRWAAAGDAPEQQAHAGAVVDLDAHRAGHTVTAAPAELAAQLGAVPGR